MAETNDSGSDSDCSSTEESETALSPCDIPVELQGLPGLSNINIGNLIITNAKDIQIGNNVQMNAPVVINVYNRTPSIEQPNDESSSFHHPPPSAEREDNSPVTFEERLVTRGEWFAMPARGEVTPLEKSPVDYVIIAHTAGTYYTDKRASINSLRSIQGSCFQRGMYDICYNFLVGGDGHIYEGRGWDKQAACAKRIDSRAVSIGFMGEYMFEPPPKKMVEAAFCLLDEGVRIGKLSPDYKLFAHKQVHNTESPGMTLIEMIKKWPHWAPYE